MSSKNTFDTWMVLVHDDYYGLYDMAKNTVKYKKSIVFLNLAKTIEPRFQNVTIDCDRFYENPDEVNAYTDGKSNIRLCSRIYLDDSITIDMMYFIINHELGHCYFHHTADEETPLEVKIQQEYDADEYGARLLYRMKMPISIVFETFEMLRKYELPSINSDHPPIDDRISKILSLKLE